MEYWERFVGNAENLKIARQVYETLHTMTDNKDAESKMIQAMINGNSGLENIPLANGSMHHNMERKYAGLFETVQSIKEYGSIFNADDLLAATLSAHPADQDPHRLAHLFDIKETYIYMHDGKYKKGPISGIKKGDVVFAPVVEIKRNGRFEPAISQGAFLVTSHAGIIPAPEVYEKNRTSSRFRERIVNMVKDAWKAVEKLTGINKPATFKTSAGKSGI